MVPKGTPHSADLTDVFRRADRRPGNEITMSAYILGQGIDVDVNTVLQGTLEHWAQHRIVTDGDWPYAGSFFEVRDTSLYDAKIDQGIGRVRRRFDENDPYRTTGQGSFGGFHHSRFI